MYLKGGSKAAPFKGKYMKEEQLLRSRKDSWNSGEDPGDSLGKSLGQIAFEFCFILVPYLMMVRGYSFSGAQDGMQCQSLKPGLLRAKLALQGVKLSPWPYLALFLVIFKIIVLKTFDIKATLS